MAQEHPHKGDFPELPGVIVWFEFSNLCGDIAI
jgi:hypothetical protein